jgi:hypothetical protein
MAVGAATTETSMSAQNAAAMARRTRPRFRPSTSDCTPATVAAE